MTAKQHLEHLHAFHKSAHELHTAGAEHHLAKAEFHKRMSKFSHEDAITDAHDQAAASHTKYAAAHAAHAEFHADAAEACQKAIGVEMNKIQPDSFSSVIPSNVPDSGFGMTAHPRAVPRFGSPDLDKAYSDVPPQFQHLVAGLEDEV